jgi:hypothetical protein
MCLHIDTQGRTQPKNEWWQLSYSTSTTYSAKGLISLKIKNLSCDMCLHC